MMTCNTRSIKTSSKPSFGLRVFSTLFLYYLFATTLICAALDILHWSICKWYVASVLFNLCNVNKSPAEMSMPISP